MAIKKQHWPAKQNLQLLDFFLLIMPFTFLFNTFDVNGAGSFAIFGQKCHKKLNRLTGHSGRAISVNFTPHFIFLPFWAKYVTKIAQVDGTHRLCQARDIIWLYCCFYRNIFWTSLKISRLNQIYHSHPITIKQIASQSF